MKPESKKYLHDMRSAAALLAEFTRRKSLDDYQADAMLRAIVDCGSSGSVVA